MTRRQYILLWIFAALFTSLASGDDQEATVFQKWKSLSASCQNLHYELMKYGPNSEYDASMFDEDIESINQALDGLVDAGELVSKKIKLIPPTEENFEKLESLIKAVYLLGDEYGVFVASEMCDLGARLNLTTFKQGQPLKLHLRLPEKDLKKFVARAKDLGLLWKEDTK